MSDKSDSSENIELINPGQEVRVVFCIMFVWAYSAVSGALVRVMYCSAEFVLRRRVESLMNSVTVTLGSICRIRSSTCMFSHAISVISDAPHLIESPAVV